MEVGVAAGETDFDAVAAAGVAFGVEGLVDVADEVDDELGGVSFASYFLGGGEGGKRGMDLGCYCALISIEIRIHKSRSLAIH
jgi:hypothetical protein